MKRLPRKRKKQVKNIVAAKTALKMAMTAMVAVQSRVQIAMIASTPIPYFGPAGVAHKAVSVVKVMADTATAIQRIMSEPPNSWMDFIR